MRTAIPPVWSADVGCSFVRACVSLNRMNCNHHEVNSAVGLIANVIALREESAIG